LTLFLYDMGRYIHLGLIMGLLLMCALLRLGAHATLLDFMAFGS